jgi:sugar-specific transcriptional regulator TrmB
MMVELGYRIRHLNAIKSSFAIADRMEYMATIVVEEEKTPSWQAIVSNAKTFVEGQQSIFDTLWSKALPAEDRIRQIEEGLKPELTETISDPYEIQKLGLDVVKSAKEELTLLFSTTNGFKRQERAGLIRLLRETDPTVKVRILLPADSALENTMKDKFAEDRRIEIRYFLKSTPQTLLTTLTTDKKLCLVIELKDDKKDNSFEAVKSATYSNSESFVWTHASIFETLWIQSELDLASRIH